MFIFNTDDETSCCWSFSLLLWNSSLSSSWSKCEFFDWSFGLQTEGSNFRNMMGTSFCLLLIGASSPWDPLLFGSAGHSSNVKTTCTTKTTNLKLMQFPLINLCSVCSCVNSNENWNDSIVQIIKLISRQMAETAIFLYLLTRVSEAFFLEARHCSIFLQVWLWRPFKDRLYDYCQYG